MVNLTVTKEENVKTTTEATEPPDQRKQSLVIPNVGEDAEQQKPAGRRVNQLKPSEHSLAAFIKAEHKKLDLRAAVSLQVLVLGANDVCPNPMTKAA